MFYIVVLAVLVCDQFTKWLAIIYLKPTGIADAVILIPGFLGLHYATNKGAAFSLFTDYPLFLTIFSTIALIGIITWHWFTPKNYKFLVFCQGLIIGGAIGNLADRFLRGYVVDFIHLHYQDVYHWPTFNIADSSIFIAVCVLIIQFLFFPHTLPAEKSSESRG